MEHDQPYILRLALPNEAIPEKERVAQHVGFGTQVQFAFAGI